MRMPQPRPRQPAQAGQVTTYPSSIGVAHLQDRVRGGLRGPPAAFRASSMRASPASAELERGSVVPEFSASFRAIALPSCSSRPKPCSVAWISSNGHAIHSFKPREPSARPGVVKARFDRADDGQRQRGHDVRAVHPSLARQNEKAARRKD
jgi:hypothetical protein